MAETNSSCKSFNDKAMEMGEILSSKMLMALIAIEQVYSAVKDFSLGFRNGVMNVFGN